MSLEKTGYTPAVVGTTRVKVAVDADGYIAPGGAGMAGTKNFSINRVSAENSLTDNTDVLNFFLNLAQGMHDSVSNTMQVKWEV